MFTTYVLIGAAIFSAAWCAFWLGVFHGERRGGRAR